MDTSLPWMIVIGQRKFTSGHRMEGGGEITTVVEELSDRFHVKQKHGRSYGGG